ncbi:hypothetical protein BGZ97_008016 [Linnemannia gamsii]|uniref:Uncharacterized protein n=1 Tax=Linnemannia gamsii TaxID=64522 RepID=A0A9P6UR51_9FUNG|nr:hypothetical protein BGZ97_008016 [Linnemannia gamsii]
MNSNEPVTRALNGSRTIIKDVFMRPCRTGIIMKLPMGEEEEPLAGLSRPITEDRVNTIPRINNTTRTCYQSLLTLRDIIQDKVDRQLHLAIIIPYLISANNANSCGNNTNNNNINHGKKSGTLLRTAQQSSG